jgi:hypothetical protein
MPRIRSGFGSGEASVDEMRDPTDDDPGPDDTRLVIQESEFARLLRVAGRGGGFDQFTKTPGHPSRGAPGPRGGPPSGDRHGDRDLVDLALLAVGLLPEEGLRKGGNEVELHLGPTAIATATGAPRLVDRLTLGPTAPGPTGAGRP